MSNTDEAQNVVRRIGYVALATLLCIAFLGAGLAIWLWASTGPDLAIGQDIPPAMVLNAVSALLVILAGISAIAIIWYLKQHQSSDSVGSKSKSVYDTSESNLESQQEMNYEEDQSSRELNTPEPEVSPDADVVDGMSASEQDAGISFSDGPAPGDEEDHNPN